METLKHCSDCKLDQSVLFFYRNRARPSGYSSQCKTCADKRRVKRSKENRQRENESRRDYYKRTYTPQNGKKKELQKFGLTLDSFSAMKEAQNDACAVCKRPEQINHTKGKKRELAVDHCHLTGRVRGLLCNACNTGIGKLKDSPQLLEAAIMYLKAAQPTSSIKENP
jgi:Recombination endonuclease VII